MKAFLVKLSCYLFCLTSILDPTNSILRLKLPIFVIFVFSLIVNDKPQIKYVGYYVFIFFVLIVSLASGIVSDADIDFQLTIQFFVFFLLFVCLLWDSYIDLFKPLVLSSLFVSIITIIGFVVMLGFPNIEGALFVFSTAHDFTFLMARRNFLGIEVVSFFYKSIPIVIIPASYYLNEIINYNKRTIKNLLFVSIFLFALFCAGNRAMIGVVFLIIFFISYGKISKWPLFKPLLIFILFVAVYVGILSITEKGEESNDIKFGHIQSYIEYFSDKWYLLLFGSGAGSLFYSKGFQEMTGVTEWTYLEMIRLYGLFGTIMILMFFTYPLRNYYRKLETIYAWKAFALGYIFYFLVSASNPYLMGSTGFLCILFMFSITSNPKFRISDNLIEDNTKVVENI